MFIKGTPCENWNRDEREGKKGWKRAEQRSARSMEKGLSREGETLQICWRMVIKGMLAGRGGVRGEQQRDEWRAAGVVGGQASEGEGGGRGGSPNP